MEKNDKIWLKMMNFGHRLGCHQMPERSFFYKDYQFPVCARCTGVIIGEIIALIIIIIGVRIRIISALAILMIMGFDWGFQFFKIKESNNIRRILSGICGGVGLSFIYYYIIYYSIMEVISLIK